VDGISNAALQQQLELVDCNCWPFNLIKTSTHKINVLLYIYNR